MSAGQLSVLFDELAAVIEDYTSVTEYRIEEVRVEEDWVFVEGFDTLTKTRFTIRFDGLVYKITFLDRRPSVTVQVEEVA